MLNVEMDFVVFDPNTVLPNLSQLSISLGKSNMNTGYVLAQVRTLAQAVTTILDKNG